MLRHLVVAIFEDEAAADAAVAGLDRWAGNEAMETTVDAHQLQAVGVMVLDEKGKSLESYRLEVPTQQC